jgi:hypothetical protein
MNLDSISGVNAQHKAQLNSVLQRTALLRRVQGLEFRKYSLDGGTGRLEKCEVVRQGPPGWTSSTRSVPKEANSLGLLAQCDTLLKWKHSRDSQILR